MDAPRLARARPLPSSAAGGDVCAIGGRPTRQLPRRRRGASAEGQRFGQRGGVGHGLGEVARPWAYRARRRSRRPPWRWFAAAGLLTLSGLVAACGAGESLLNLCRR